MCHQPARPFPPSGDINEGTQQSIGHHRTFLTKARRRTALATACTVVRARPVSVCSASLKLFHHMRNLHNMFIGVPPPRATSALTHKPKTSLSRRVFVCFVKERCADLL